MTAGAWNLMLLVQQPDPFQPGADLGQTSTLHTRLRRKPGVDRPIFGFSHSAAVAAVIEQAKAMVKPVLALIGSPKHAQRAPASEVMHGLDAQALHSVRQLGRGPGDTAA